MTLTQCALHKILGFWSQCYNHVMGARRRLNWIVGDRLLVPNFHQLPSLKDFFLLGLKNKHTQALPLKEDFRQFARPGNSRVSRLHEVKRTYLNASCLSNAKQKFTRNWATKVPGNNQTQLVLRQTKLNSKYQPINLYRSMHNKASSKLKPKLHNLQNNVMLVYKHQTTSFQSTWIILHEHGAIHPEKSSKY